MAEFFVVRHGEDVPKSEDFQIVHGSVDTPLTPEGYRQAAKTGKQLAQYNVVAIHAPKLARTQDTAVAIWKNLGESCLIADNTLAGRNMGVFALRGHKAMAPVATETHYNLQGEPYFIEVPGAESLDVCYKRLRVAYSALVDRYVNTDGAVVMVTQHFAGTLLRGVHDNLSLLEATEYGDLAHAGVARLIPGQCSVESHVLIPSSQ